MCVRQGWLLLNLDLLLKHSACTPAAAGSSSYEVTISNADPTQGVAVSLHVDGRAAEPPDIHCRPAGTDSFQALPSVQPAAIPAASSVVCSLAVPPSDRASRPVRVSAVGEDGQVFDVALLHPDTPAVTPGAPAGNTAPATTLFGTHGRGMPAQVSALGAGVYPVAADVARACAA